MGEIVKFARTDYRGVEKTFGIKPGDRRRHIYLVGKTGMGKTEMLKNMAIQDIQAGRGVGIVDPHGEFAQSVLDFVPKRRINDVIYFNPSDIDFPIGFNVMEKVDFAHRHLVSSGILGVFRKIWPEFWGPRMEYILQNAILALLENQGTTLLGINRMLSDREFRRRIVRKVTDPMVKAFWEKEFANYSSRFKEEAIAPIQNKVGQFISAPILRNIIGQVKSAINMRKVMDEGKILIFNLARGEIGEDPSRLLGALSITKIQLAAMSRVNIPEEERKDFFLYCDEFQDYATASFVNILSEARKYRLSLTIAHQYIAQMDEAIREAVFGNIGTLVCFRVGARDARFLQDEFRPEFSVEDLVNLPKYHIYLRLMINGVASRPFSAVTLPPFEVPRESFRDKIIKVSRERYALPREKVESKIIRWMGKED